MSRPEKFVTGLAVAVLLAGFAADGFTKLVRTSHHGSSPMIDVAHSTLHRKIGQSLTLDWVNDKADQTATMQIICREDDRSSCGAIKNLVCTKVFKCASDDGMRSNSQPAVNDSGYTVKALGIQLFPTGLKLRAVKIVSPRATNRFAAQAAGPQA